MKPSLRPLTLAVALALGLGGWSAARAQDLARAYQQALANDALVASSRSALEATRERVVQARAAMLPAVNATGQINRQNVETNLAPARAFTTRAYGVNLSFPLVRLQNFEAWEQSKLQVAVGEAQLEQAMQDLMIRVSQAYFDVLSSQDNLATIRAQKRAIAEQLASAKRNFEVGTATITDQQEAQARFDLTVAQELAAENDLAVKQAALALLTGKPIGQLKTLNRGVALREPEPAVEGTWTDSARQYNLAVQQAQVATEIARREIEKQRFGHYPTLDLVGTVGRNENGSLQLFGVKSTSGAIGVQLNLPLYAGGGIDARVREAIASSGKSLTDLENARRQAEQGTRTAFLGVRSGLGQVRALEAAERSSQLALDSNLLGYQVGVRINIDVLNAQQQLFTTRRDLAKARYDVLVNGLKLKQSAGTLKEEDLTTVNALLGDPAPDPVPVPAPAPAAAGAAAPAGAAPPAGTAAPAPGAGTPSGAPREPARGRNARVTKPIPAVPSSGGPAR